MSRAKRAGWVLVGVLIGGLGSPSVVAGAFSSEWSTTTGTVSEFAHDSYLLNSLLSSIATTG
jgi:hypothetical protein